MMTPRISLTRNKALLSESGDYPRNLMDIPK